MKKSPRPDRLFQEAERLTLPPGLWGRIAEHSPLAGSEARERSLWEAPMLRAAAVLALAATVLGLAVFGISRRGAEAEAIATTTADETQAAAGTEEEVIDPELLAWQADLGEMDFEAEAAEEADEAEEVL